MPSISVSCKITKNPWRKRAKREDNLLLFLKAGLFSITIRKRRCIGVVLLLVDVNDTGHYERGREPFCRSNP